MDIWTTLGGVPFMLANSIKPAAMHVNRIRIFEAIVTALVVGILSSAAAAYVTLRVMERQNDTLVADAVEGRKVTVGIVTQLAAVQATLVGVVMQQQTFAAQMHERVMTLERRTYEPPAYAPTGRRGR